MDDQVSTAPHPILELDRTPQQSPARSRRSGLARGALLLIVLVAASVAVGYWYVTRDEVSTDDAFIEGRVVTVAPQVSGTVVALHVDDNQRVKTGDVLIEIDPSSYQALRDQAAASLKVAEAQLANARIALDAARIDYPARLAGAQAQLEAARATQARADADARRQRSLPKAATTQQELDSANAALRSATAQVAQNEATVRQANLVGQFIGQAEAQVHQLEAQVALARAQLAQAELNLSWTRVTAPQDGWVTKRNVEAGNYVQSGQSILALVTPQVWVAANFRESDLEHMREGQPVDIRVDAYPSLRLTGHVDSVQLGTGGRFTAFPPENATGNFVKIVQRVPVKIVIDHGLDPGQRLPLGLSVVPTVRLK